MERRAMFGGARNALENRSTQAARDALRRRQKEKKSRIVKRHVMYKQKKRLLQDVEASEEHRPIVISELGRPGDGDDDDKDISDKNDSIAEPNITSSRAAKSSKRASSLQETNENVSADKSDIANSDVDGTNKPNPKGLRSGEADVLEHDETENGDSKSNEEGTQESREDQIQENGTQSENTAGDSLKKGKYVPFLKERKEYEKLQRQRERQERDRQGRIKKREKMLKQSKKRRAKEGKQYRAATARGQPKLKYRVESLLKRIQKDAS